MNDYPMTEIKRLLEDADDALLAAMREIDEPHGLLGSAQDEGFQQRLEREPELKEMYCRIRFLRYQIDVLWTSQLKKWLAGEAMMRKADFEATDSCRY